MMSVWHHHDVSVLSRGREDIARFFNLDPKEDVRIDCFEFSFGQKNGPGMRLGKIVEQNPELIFLVKQTIEIDAEVWWIERFDQINKKHQYILIQKFGYMENEINKKILEKYTEWCPSLPEKHFVKLKGFECFRWKSFFNDFDKVAEMLNNEDQYKEMSTVFSNEDAVHPDEEEPGWPFDEDLL